MSHTQPKTTVTSTRTIHSIPTTITLQAFADRVLVIITQIGKIGNLIQVSVPSPGSLLPASSPSPHYMNDGSAPSDNNPYQDDTLPTPPASVTILPLLGTAPSQQHQILHDLYASQIATLLWTTSEVQSDNVRLVFDAGMGRKPVIVGIGLKKEPGTKWDEEREREMFRGVMKFLTDVLRGQSG